MRASGFDDAIVADLPNLTRAAHAMTRQPQEVADLVHDTIVKALRFADTFDGTDMHRWLFTVMFNLYRDKRRRLGRIVEDPGDERALLIEIEPNQIPQVELQETLAAIDGLPMAFRDVMQLAAAGMDQQEIAETAGGRPCHRQNSHLEGAQAAHARRLRVVPPASDAIPMPDDLPSGPAEPWTAAT